MFTGIQSFMGGLGLFKPKVASINPAQTQKFEELEGLRGYAALAVLLRHLIYGPDETVGGFGLLAIFGAFAHTAVLIFFVLSGFVIGYTTKEEFSGKQAKIYLLKRFVRLYPIYLVCIALSFAVQGDFTLGQLMGHLFFMQGWLVEMVESNGPLWSLHCEVLFYLLFLVIWKFKISPIKAFSFCVICGFLSIFIKWHLLKILGYFSLWMLGFWMAKNREQLKQKYESQSFRFWSAIFLSTAFIAANAIELILMTFKLKNDPFMPDLPSVVTDILLVGLIACIVASVMGFQVPGLLVSQAIAVSSTTVAVGFAHGKGILPTMQNYQLALFFLVLAIVFYPIKSIPMATLRHASDVGSISYSLYVVHRPIQLVVYDLMGGETGIHYWLPNFWSASFCVVVLSVALSVVLERHIQPIISRFFKPYLKAA
jgi:peptidoglycan/LPS O-acetylase OafA/YrhL